MKHLFFFAILLLGLFGVACTEENTYLTPTEPPALLEVSGSCDADGLEIYCTDETIGGDRTEKVQWRILSGLIEVDAATGSRGKQVRMLVEEAGSYSVRQIVFPSDGGEPIEGSVIPVVVTG